MVGRTFVMIKPDAVGRRLCGRIIQRFESKGLKLIGLKMQIMSRNMAEKLYAEHKGRNYFDDLIGFITSGPSVQMVLEGEQAVKVVRKIIGATDCSEAEMGTIRGDLGLTRRNLIHASDSAETADRETALFFDKKELVEYVMPDEIWLTYSLDK